MRLFDSGESTTPRFSCSGTVLRGALRVGAKSADGFWEAWTVTAGLVAGLMAIAAGLTAGAIGDAESDVTGAIDAVVVGKTVHCASPVDRINSVPFVIRI